MRFLVTGGCGFVGSAVVRELVAAGRPVLNIDRRRRSMPTPQLAVVAAKPGYARLEANIGDRTMMRAIISEFRPDAVIHLAASADDHPSALFDTDVAGVFSLLEAVRVLPTPSRIVHSLLQVADDATPDPRAAAQSAAASLVADWSRAHGMSAIACTASDLFGAFQPETALLPRLVADLSAGRTVSLPPDGGPTRDWLCVRDFARGLIAAAEKGRPGATYEFTACAERRDAELADTVAMLLDGRIARRAGATHADLIHLDADASITPDAPMLDATAAETDLGWLPASFHKQLDRTVAALIPRQAQTYAIAAE